VPLSEWLAEPATRAEIKRRFRAFLDTYEEPAAPARVYERVIDRMCAGGGQSLVISYLHLSRFAPTLAIWLADQPRAMLALLDAAARGAVAARYADYYNASDVVVRVSGMPIPDELRDLRQQHLNVLVRVGGVVTRRGGVLPQQLIVRYKCRTLGCGGGFSAPVLLAAARAADAAAAGSCPACGSRYSRDSVVETVRYRNFQRLTLQEAPEAVPAGRMPRAKEVILTGDIIDCARPGERVEVTGIYTHQFDATLNARNGFPTFSTLIEANFVDKLSDKAAHMTITDEDKRRFDELSRDAHVVRRIVRSIAPSIYGNDRAKLAVALAMFGGREKNVNNKHNIRGDVNVLLLGDPGVAKSQILKYVEKTAPRCVYTTGKGASAVGLTASVHKDPTTGEWTLEAGALVLADRGVCW
jgi:DNA replication licensing factor MCM2